MTTPRDLLFVAIDVDSSRPLERGDLSLALAGAELIDLLGAEAISLEDGSLVPGHGRSMDDRLLDEAEASLVPQAPYESVDDWLWRRGRGLAAAYLAALEAEGQLVRQRRRRLFGGKSPLVPADSSAHRLATDRWTSAEPVLGALAAAVGIHREHSEDPPDVTDDAVASVLAAVNDALLQLEVERQRRAIDEAAFDNIWRGE